MVNNEDLQQDELKKEEEAEDPNPLDKSPAKKDPEKTGEAEPDPVLGDDVNETLEKTTGDEPGVGDTIGDIVNRSENSLRRSKKEPAEE